MLEKPAVQFGALLLLSDRTEIFDKLWVTRGNAVAFDEDVKK